MSALLLLLLQQSESPAWRFLVEKYDADHDGRIVAAEYTRGAASYAQLDHDGDGVLTAEDFSEAGIAAWREQHRKDRMMKGVLMSYFQDDKDPDLLRAELVSKLTEFDKNKDARLSAGEFEKIAKEVPKARQKIHTPEEAWAHLTQILAQNGDLNLRHADLAAAFDKLDPERAGLLKQFGRKKADLPLKPKDKPLGLLFGSFT